MAAYGFVASVVLVGLGLFNMSSDDDKNFADAFPVIGRMLRYALYAGIVVVIVAKAVTWFGV